MGRKEWKIWENIQARMPGQPEKCPQPTPKASDDRLTDDTGLTLGQRRVLVALGQQKEM